MLHGPGLEVARVTWQERWGQHSFCKVKFRVSHLDLQSISGFLNGGTGVWLSQHHLLPAPSLPLWLVPWSRHMSPPLPACLLPLPLHRCRFAPHLLHDCLACSPPSLLLFELGDRLVRTRGKPCWGYLLAFFEFILPCRKLTCFRDWIFPSTHESHLVNLVLFVLHSCLNFFFPVEVLHSFG